MSSLPVDIIPALIPNNRVELEVGATRIALFSKKLHLDVNDGVFDPALSWPCGEGQWEELERATVLAGCESLEVMVHLMVSDPERIGALFARAGASSIVGQFESFQDIGELRTVARAWKQAGARRVGVALLLDTSLSTAKLTALVECVDFVQVMSIAHVGFQKQAFDERALERIQMIHTAFPELPIAVDGHVNEDTILSLHAAGATTFIVGSAIADAENPKEMYVQLAEMVK